MTHRTTLRSAFACVLTLLLSATAHAQLFRAYLESTGSDANPCTLPAPCRLLPAALSAVADGGEIWMLDSANYNSSQVLITKSVTIRAVPGAVGSVVATGTFGGALNIQTPGVKVALRNLVIVPLPDATGVSAIYMIDGAGLTVENCLIANLPGIGIFVNTAATVRITDTTIRDNAGDGVRLLAGVRATVVRATISGNANAAIAVYGLAASSTTSADIADSTLDANFTGVGTGSTNASAVVKVSVHGSRIVRNAGFGMFAASDSGAAVTLSASDNMISNNGSAALAAISPSSKVWASGNTISANAQGFNNLGGGLFESAGNNALRNNGTDSSGTITLVATD